MAKENWQRSYVIEFGTPERNLSQYKIEAVSVLKPEFLPKFEVDGITTPSNAIRMSNLASEGKSKRGFTFTLDSVRSLATSNSSSEITTIQLYNIDKKSSDVLQQEGSVIRVYAGYGDEVTLAYSGDIVDVKPKNIGNDKIYQITCSDGANDEKNTKISINYEEGTSDSDIIVDLVNRYPATSLGIADLASLSDRVETGGRSFCGRLVTELDKFLTQYGLNYGRFNGKFVIYPYRLDEEFADVLVRTNYNLTADLIKSIEPQNNNGSKSSSDTKEETGIIVNTFYLPIELGQMITIPKSASEEYSGTYTVRRIRTSLQSHGSVWDVSLTGIKI